MNVSLAEATAAARRIQAGLDVRAPGRAEWEQRANDYEDEGDVHQFQYAEVVVAGLMLASGLEDDFRLLAGFVLAGDTERLRTALQRVAETTALPYAAEPMLLVDLARDIARAALVGGDSP